MAILAMCGFETGDFFEADSVTGSPTVQSSIKRTGSYALQSAVGSNSYVSFRKFSSSGKLTDITETTRYVTFYLYLNALGTGEVRVLITNTLTLRVRGTSFNPGQIYMYGQAASASAATLTTGQWYRIDLKIVRNGTCELQVDGGTAVTCTGADSTGVDISIGQCLSSTNFQCCIDDFIAADSDIRGAVEIKAALPTGDSAANTNWTASAGNKWECVDDLPPSSGDYVDSGTAAGSMDYGVTHASCATLGITGEIKAVKVLAQMWEAASTTTQGAVGIRSGADYMTANVDIGDTTAIQMGSHFVIDPNTGVAWTTSGIDSAEPVIRRSSSDTSAIRCGFLALMVAYRPPQTVLAPAGAPAALAWTGYAPTGRAITVAPAGSPAALAWTGYAPTPVRTVRAAAGAPAGVAWTGYAPTGKHIAVVSAGGPAAVAWSGHAATGVMVYALRPRSGVRIELYSREWDGAAFVETKIGAGPIPAISARYSEAEGEIGAFSFTMPADHPRAALLDPSIAVPGARYARIYVGGEGYVFQGEITRIQRSAAADGRRVITASGWSSARELTRLKTGFGFKLTDATMAAAVSAILADTGWTAGSIAAAAISSYVLEANGASRFQALRRLAEIQGFMLRVNSTTRTVDMGPLGTNPAGVRFTALEGPISPRFRSSVAKVIPIADAQIVSQSEDVRNKVRIIGQVQGFDGDDLTMEDSTLSSPYVRYAEAQPDGRFVYYIKDQPSIDAHGVFEEDLVQRDIRLIGQGAAERERAANSLYGAAVTYLLKHKDPVKTFAMTPAGLRHLVEDVDIAPVAGRYPVWFRGWRQEGSGRRVWVEIDEDLYLLRRERSIESNGQSRWSLGWSTTTRELPTDSEQVASELNSLKAAVAARMPQITYGGYPPVGRLDQSGNQFLDPTGSGRVGIWGLAEFSDNPLSLGHYANWYFINYSDKVQSSLSVRRGGAPSRGFAVSDFALNGHVAAPLNTFLGLSGSGGAGVGATIASGAITVDRSTVLVDTEGLAATDDLDTITAATTPHALLYLTSSAGGRDVVVRNGVGNIRLNTPKFTMEMPSIDWLLLVRCPDMYWNELARSGGSGGTMKATNDGAYFLPPGPERGQFLLSDYTTWRPLSRQIAPAAAPTVTTGSGGLSAVSMPASIAAGDLLIAFCSTNTTGGHSTPSGWTKLKEITEVGGGFPNTLACFTKTAAGTESGTTPSFTAGSANCAAHVYRIPAGKWTGSVAVSSGAHGTVSSINPDAVTFTSGRGLFFAAVGYYNGASVSSYAYGGGANATNSFVTDTGLGSDYLGKDITSGSEDPGWGGTVTSWTAMTVAVRAADNAVAANTTITNVIISPAGTPDYGQIEFATGAPGAEVSIGEHKMVPGDSTPFVPIDLAAGARLSCRLSMSGGGYVSVQLLDEDDQG